MKIKISFNLENLQKNTIVVLSFVVFILFNLIISQIPWRLDLSKDKTFSLSSSTKQILKKVDDVLRIKFYVSSDLPIRLIPLKNTVWDFLKEYQRANSNIKIALVYPDKDEKAKREADEAGLPELRFSEYEESKQAVSKGYFGIIVFYHDKSEVIPNAANFENLEYEISTAIYRLVNKELPKVAVLGYDNPFFNKTSPISNFHKLLSKSLQLNYISANDLDKDYAVLIFFDDGETKVSTDEAEKIDKFLASGKKGIFFVDGVWVKDDLSYTDASHNLFSLLEKRGLKLEKNLVLSTASERIVFGDQYQIYVVPYPFWVKTNIFNFSSGYFSNVDVLTFPWASSISLKDNNGYKTDWLVKSVKESWEQGGAFQLLPDQISAPNNFGQFVLSAKSKKGKEEVILFGSRRFVLDNYLKSNSNLELVSNIALSLASNGLLSGIKIKKVNIYLVPKLPDFQREVVKYGASLFLPFLYLVFGIIKVLKRR